MPGTLTFRPLSAKLTRDTEIFGQMDPYCKIHLGKQKVSGQVCKNGGKHPVWDDNIVIKSNNEPVCHLELKEKDWLLPDGTIGECDINLKEVENKQRVLKWYHLYYTGKPVGQILIEINYEDAHRTQNVPLSQQPVPSNWTEVKQVDNLPNTLGQMVNNNVHPKIAQVGPGVIHGYIPQADQFPNQINQHNPSNQFNNNYQNQPQPQPQNNYYNQNFQADMYAPPAYENIEGNTYKYPTFENQNFGNNNFDNHAATGVHEVIDYRNQQNQQPTYNTQKSYPGVTGEALAPSQHHVQEDNSMGWDPVKVIRGALGRK